jgi:hypothetical protein
VHVVSKQKIPESGCPKDTASEVMFLLSLPSFHWWRWVAPSCVSVICALCSKEKLCLPKGLLLIASWCIVQETRKSGTQANELNVHEIPLRRWSNIIHSRYLEIKPWMCQYRPCINVLWHVWFCLHWWKIVSWNIVVFCFVLSIHQPNTTLSRALCRLQAWWHTS